MPKRNPDFVAQVWNYVVTFESDSEPGRTARGTVQGSTFPTAAQRAIKDARRQLPRLRASSVCVVIEKYHGPNDFAA